MSSKPLYLLGEAGSVFVDEKVKSHYRNEVMIIAQPEEAGRIIISSEEQAPSQPFTTTLSPRDADEDFINEKKSHYDFEKTISIRAWGRDVAHALAAKINRVKESIILEGESARTVQAMTTEIRTYLTEYGHADEDKNKKSGFSGMFRKKSQAAKPQTDANAFLKKTLRMLEALSEAVYQDQQLCMEKISAIESESSDFGLFGTALSLHIDALSEQYKRVVAKQTGMDYNPVDKRPDMVRRELQSRKEELSRSRTVWSLASKGIENYIECKNSQYEALDLLYAKIHTDVISLIRSAMVSTQGADAKNDERAGKAAILSVIDGLRPVLSDLEEVNMAGKTFDFALVEGDLERLTPLSYRPQSETLALPAPTHF